MITEMNPPSPCLRSASLALLALAAASQISIAEELRIPAFTAYSEPDARSPRIEAPAGITHWTDPKDRISWYGELKSAGSIDAEVALVLPSGETSKLKLSVDQASREVTVTGDSAPVVAKFGAFDGIPAGYQRFTLESLNPKGKDAGNVLELRLAGTACEGAHFNLDPRRNAASVHLFYPPPPKLDIRAFYCEVTAVEDPTGTYYEACGFQRGYMGMQVNGPKERRIIFSVWDSGAGANANARDGVADNDRTQLKSKGEGVEASVFGGEGTGGHSHLVYDWKTGEPQRFLVTSAPGDGGSAIYSGYWFHPEKKEWKLMASFSAPKTSASLSGLYSFSEDFDGSNGQLRRKALFGNQWARSDDGAWHEITTATFSHDGTGKINRLDRFMGLENGQFFLSNGGFIPGFTNYGEPFTRPAGGKPPADVAALR